MAIGAADSNEQRLDALHFECNTVEKDRQSAARRLVVCGAACSTTVDALLVVLAGLPAVRHLSRRLNARQQSTTLCGFGSRSSSGWCQWWWMV